ncbi:MAG: DUF4168 domain-containing protein [Pseudanabaenaceae cyanobacterium bins.39]|nr:DUF4168 domain-containing protein [Pseudanabaenaceae cyanobacterium bins.39]
MKIDLRRFWQKYLPKNHKPIINTSPQIAPHLILRQSLLGIVSACLTLVSTETMIGLVNRDRSMAYAQISPTLLELNNILNQAVFGDDQITRYAMAVNAIENKRLEIFREAKNNPQWSSVANLAESQQTKVCDLKEQPPFLQSLCDQLRSFTEEEIRRRGFSNREFNQITREQRQDANLRSLIQTRQMQLRSVK